MVVAQEDPGQTVRDLVAHLEEVHELAGARGAFDFGSCRRSTNRSSAAHGVMSVFTGIQIGTSGRVPTPAWVRRQLQLAGPIWMPVNTLIIRALLNFYLYYGDNFKIECPRGSGKLMNLFEVSNEISDRLTRIFLRDDHGRRPVYGGTRSFSKIHIA